MTIRTTIVKLLTGAFALSIKADPATLTANRTLSINGDWVAGYLPQIDPADATKLRWISAGSLGGGTVTSVSTGANLSSIISIANSTSTPTLSLASQASGLVLASPAGASGDPTFRALVSTDIPNLSASKITTGTLAYSLLPVGTTASTVAAGNDSRFHTQNSDVGTTSTTFYLGGASGPKLKSNAGAVEVRNNADTGWADLVVNNLFVRGTQTIVDSNTVNIGDNILTLNSDFTGSTPTENSGLTINRDTAAGGNANLTWNESAKYWQAGLTGSELQLARTYRVSFTSASLLSGLLTVTHGLGNNDVQYTVWDNAGVQFYPGATATSSTVLTLDFADVTITGTWKVVVTG